MGRCCLVFRWTRLKPKYLYMSSLVTHFFKICLLRAAGDKARKCVLLGYLAVPSPVSMAEFHQTFGFGAKPFPLPLPVLFLKQNSLKDAFQHQSHTFIHPYHHSAFDWPAPSCDNIDCCSRELETTATCPLLGS